MLRLEDIKKNYEAGGQSFPALKGISLAFRKNEFVSILGPSGCGKTTLLNIIGGLDHYSSGDLVIEGKSTKEYSSHDWDVYRNHRIGFIFQSYNLIPHQNILENVELALTIAGYSKEEKRKKAMKALDKVGLKNAYKKMPNQLSGGQCQRVAIARALVNEPDILLGDEPTGALDSKTSVQVMDLIKKISKKKLVIMVTHNPPLAKQYSTRIISLLDGKVVNDTNPYKLEDEKSEKRGKFVGVKSSESNELIKPDKAKMSFWEAFKLSAKNLISKKKRTIMVIAASSIGIVGVSAVLAVSTGVRGYIGNMENDMLSGNPVRVSETSLDLVSVLTNLSNLVKAQAISESWKDGAIDVEYLTKILIENAKSGSIITNDISDYYVEYVKEMPKTIMADSYLDYGTSFANNIYTVSEVEEVDDFYKPKAGETEENKTRVAYSLSGLKNIYTAILATLDDGKGTSFVPLANIAANFPNVFYQGLDNNNYIKSQYNVLYGSLPNEGAENECVVVLNRRNKLADLVITLAGMFSEKDFMKAMWQFIEENPDMSKVIKDIPFEKIVGQKLFYVPNGKEGKEGAFQKDPYLGKTLGKYNYNYKFKYDKNLHTLTRKQKGEETTPYSINISDNEGDAHEIKIVGIIAPKEGKNYGSLPSGIYFRTPLANRVMKENAESDMAKFMIEGSEGETKIIKSKPYYDNCVFIPNDTLKDVKSVGLTYDISFMRLDKEGKPIEGEGGRLDTYGTVGDSNLILTGADDPFFIPDPEHPEVKADVGTIIKSTLTSRAFMGLKAIEKQKTNNNSNDAKEYEFKKVVRRLEIYNEDFSKKDDAIKYLDKWNSSEKITINDPYNPGKTIELDGVGTKSPNARIRVTYTDNLTLIILMINNLINITTISLTIFASLALVVSTVMIGIITYISVMERIKEIGVIRSLGGREKDVSHLFNAETFILGGLSGLFGIAITYVFELILDVVILAKYKIPMIANLKWYTAIIMIVLSIVLTAISGLIPARSAAKKDPVNALRSE